MILTALRAKGLLGRSPYTYFFVSGAAQILWLIGAALLDALTKAGRFHGSEVDTFAFPLLNCYLLSFVGGALMGVIHSVGGWLSGRRDRGLEILSLLLILLFVYNILFFFVHVLLIGYVQYSSNGQTQFSVLAGSIGSGLFYLYVGLAIALPVWRQITAYRNKSRTANAQS